MFKIKDLMITILPEAQGAVAAQCYPPTDCRCTNACTPPCSAGCSDCTICSACTGCTPHACTGGTLPPRQQPLTLEGLAVLKAQLRQQLVAVEQQEKAAHESLAPASLEEAEALEKKLVEALDEIKTIKATFKKKKKA